MSRRAPTPSRRRLLLAVALLAAVGLAIDQTRPPQAQLTSRAALAAIDLYQATLSRPLDRLGGRCRFRPTCSLYGELVIRRDGLLVGGAKTVWRILRCGPWTPVGTEDPAEPAQPVPAKRAPQPPAAA